MPAFRFFHFRILLRNDLNGATELMCTHFHTGQFDGVEDAHLRLPGSGRVREGNLETIVSKF
ncbi:MAG: hypothetical protein AA931_08025 [Peptococcaceae bacterium 1109]|nr:MAG: hypothetical protein AA931_08025 [Peptococcaceae bacterium 1109]